MADMQMELFSWEDLFGIEEEKPLPLEREFWITLEDETQIRVVFEYITNTMPHYNFYGDITETGYRSHFPGYGVIPEQDIVPLAIEAASFIRAEYLKNKLLEERKRSRKKRKEG
jgi:hypothetical protein